MAFAISFLVLGILCMVLGSAVMFLFGYALKLTFDTAWFIVTGVLVVCLLALKFISFPFKRKKVIA